MTQCPLLGNVRRRLAAEEHEGVRRQLTLLPPVKLSRLQQRIVGAWSFRVKVLEGENDSEEHPKNVVRVGVMQSCLLLGCCVALRWLTYRIKCCLCRCGWVSWPAVPRPGLVLQRSGIFLLPVPTRISRRWFPVLSWERYCPIWCLCIKRLGFSV